MGAAEHLKESSTPSYELDCFVAPDESYLLLGVMEEKTDWEITISTLARK
ncbi:MAG: hypothetical protein WDO15_09300 [Bacteroidota bacterium]